MCGTRLLAPHKRGGAGHLQFSSVAEDLDLDEGMGEERAPKAPAEGRRAAGKGPKAEEAAGRRRADVAAGEGGAS